MKVKKLILMNFKIKSIDKSYKEIKLKIILKLYYLMIPYSNKEIRLMTQKLNV